MRSLQINIRQGRGEEQEPWLTPKLQRQVSTSSIFIGLLGKSPPPLRYATWTHILRSTSLLILCWLVTGLQGQWSPGADTDDMDSLEHGGQLVAMCLPAFATSALSKYVSSKMLSQEELSICSRKTDQQQLKHIFKNLGSGCKTI